MKSCRRVLRLVSILHQHPIARLTLVLHANPGDTYCCVGRHLYRSQATSLVSFLAQL
jgi:hypothetical protein